MSLYDFKYESVFLLFETGCSSSSSDGRCLTRCPYNCKTCNIKTSLCLSCESGYYGPNCTKLCSENCLNKACHVNTGYCVKCPTGYFDHNCSTRCPQNCHDQRCNITTGHCFSCKPGYQSANCNQRRFIEHNIHWICAKMQFVIVYRKLLIHKLTYPILALNHQI